MSTTSNPFSILPSMNASIPKPAGPQAQINAVPLASSSLSNAQFTGLVPPNAQIVPTNQPVQVDQTVNAPELVPRSPQITMNVPASPSRSLNGNPVQITVPQAPSSPTARSALLNLSNVPLQQDANIPPINIPEAGLFPSIKVINTTSSLPIKPTVEIMNQDFEVRDYQGLIANSSLENELLNAGYVPLSKIVIKTDSGDKRTQYIKAINKKGQKVFILVDVNGYTTARSTDLTLIESHNAQMVPYSLKTGAYNCAGKDVCGVAFECGSDAVCILSHGPKDLTPKEANFMFVEQPTTAVASVDIEGTIMTYPVIRLSEIRANPSLVLTNTDIVTRRLRNTAYTAELQELSTIQQSINKLNAAFAEFNKMREDVACKLNRTLTQLEQWNDIYIANPPATDEAKDKYRRLQFNLAQRNEGISTLLRSIKKVTDKRSEIDIITNDINEITDFCKKEFATVEFANTE